MFTIDKNVKDQKERKLIFNNNKDIQLIDWKVNIISEFQNTFNFKINK